MVHAVHKKMYGLRYVVPKIPVHWRSDISKASSTPIRDHQCSTFSFDTCASSSLLADSIPFEQSSLSSRKLIDSVLQDVNSPAINAYTQVDPESTRSGDPEPGDYLPQSSSWTKHLVDGNAKGECWPGLSALIAFIPDHKLSYTLPTKIENETL